ncbi:MAG: flagellar basal-body MS-ring/collar protein FliF [Pseudomonadota bacterium]
MAETEVVNVAGQTRLWDIPGVRQLAILIGIAAAVAAGVNVVLWSQDPSFKPLREVSETDRLEVINSLESLNIRYRVDSGNGMIMVPADQYQQVAASLQSDGLMGAASLSMDGIYQEKGFGTSQFEELARHQVALQNKIAETIMTVRVIQNARVMLALPERSPFLRDRKKPQASVTVVVRPGAVLEPHQVQGIIHTVASAVPGLETSAVSVMNQFGELLTTSSQSMHMDQTTTEFEFQQKYQDRLVSKIEALLMPMMGGPGRVRAEVTAQMDFTQSERTTETFEPSQDDKIRSSIEERTVNSEGNPAGVPGALTNQPPTTPAEEVGEAENQSQSSSESSQRVYELDKAITNVKNSTGTLTRLSIALLLDHKPAVNAESGETEMVPLSEEEIQRASDLAKNAVGFDEARGDTFFVANAPFIPPPAMEPPPATPIWQQAWVLNIGKQVLAALVVLGLGFGLLKPLFNNLSQPPVLKTMTERGAAPGLTGPGSQEEKVPPDPISFARSLSAQDPKRVAQVMKDWVADE